MNRIFKPPTQIGVSLLEVLITIIIVSFGLLGIASMMINSLKSNQGSYTRTQANLLANDIIERMRANKAAAEAPALPYNLTLNDAPTGTTIPAADLTQWRSALASTLLSGTGSVNIDAATQTVRIVVQWNDSRLEGGSNNQQITVETRL